MSLDTNDFNKQIRRSQHGLQPSFFPIVLDMTAVANGTEFEVNINPCDHIWIPTFYDVTLGQNPVVVFGAPLNAGTAIIGPNFNRAPPAPVFGAGSPVGMNIFDVWNGLEGFYQQAATIFALRFNSARSPWLLWGLSNLLSTDYTNGQFAFGQGDCMRSISGPIARMWCKKIAPAFIGGVANQLADRVILMSSLGFSQQTAGAVASAVDANTAGQPPISPMSISGGGYQITVLNSLESMELNLPEPGELR